jgi:hypothetical protein
MPTGDGKLNLQSPIYFSLPHPTGELGGGCTSGGESHETGPFGPCEKGLALSGLSQNLSRKFLSVEWVDTGLGNWLRGY